MGAIQNQINQVLGGIGAAAVVASNAIAANEKAAEAEKLAKEKDIEQGTLAKEQYHEAKADIAKLQGESEEASKALTIANQKVEATKGWDMEGKNKAMLEGKATKRLTEQQAAQRAFDELQDRIEAKKAMMSRSENIMKRTGLWEGNK